MSRILIVDDEVAILGLLSSAYRSAGYEVTTAKSGEEALAICETNTFDVVLSDVTMPGIDGHQTMSRIRVHQPHVVSILMSGRHLACAGACCVPVKHCTWLQKPFLPDVAVSTSNRLLAARQSALVN